MALRKPLVLNAGQVQQLQSADSLDVSAIGGGEIVNQTNDEASPIVIGAPVYSDAADGVKKAKADASGTCRVLGLVKDASIANGVAGAVLVSGILTATATQWDAVAGTTGGLAFGVPYYLSAATGGIMTASAPSTVGQYVTKVGVALSTTELMVNIEQPILL